MSTIASYGARPNDKQLGGLWEFPGGKVHPGERPEEALLRELAQEVGIKVEPACLAPLTFASHAYDEIHLLMPLYICRKWEGFLDAREGASVEMGAARDLRNYPMPPADAPLIPPLIDFWAESYIRASCTHITVIPHGDPHSRTRTRIPMAAAISAAPSRSASRSIPPLLRSRRSTESTVIPSRSCPMPGTISATCWGLRSPGAPRPRRPAADRALHLRVRRHIDPCGSVQCAVPADRGRRDLVGSDPAPDESGPVAGRDRDDRGGDRRSVNGVTALLFASGRKGDLNIRGAFLHMLADASDCSPASSSTGW